MYEEDLESLVVHDHFAKEYYRYKSDPSQGRLAILTIVFVIVAVIIWAIIILSKPRWCCTGSNIDSGKSFGAALIIAFVIIIAITVIWMVVIAKKTK